jgi:hypothetical protein
MAAVLILLVALLMGGTAFAQDATVLRNDEFSVSFTMPEGWVQAEGNERAIFNVKHDESQSQIEVIATELMSPDVADVFYDTFHETLTLSSFSQEERSEATYGAHTGTLTKYRFEYAGVVLRVVAFQFTQESTAYLVVGYIKADEFETHRPAFEGAVSSLAFGAN